MKSENDQFNTSLAHERATTHAMQELNRLGSGRPLQASPRRSSTQPKNVCGGRGGRRAATALQPTPTPSPPGILRATPLRPLAIVLCLAAGAALCAALFPLSQAIELGRDEGFELAKAFLQYRGFHLYSQIWSDQPPLFTAIVAGMFGFTGPSIFWPRLLVVVFSFCLLLAIFAVVRRNSGPIAACASAILLLSAPLYLPLSVSAMQEVPAFSLGMLCVWALFLWTRTAKRWYLLCSGALMGAAVMIKFTAGLLIPAILLQVLLASRAGQSLFKTAIRSSYLWCSAAAATIALAAISFGVGNFSMLVSPHLQTQAQPGISSPSSFVMPGILLLSHWEVWLGAAIALVLTVARNEWDEAAFPLTLLVTVSVVHWLHRPWFYPYYLHHAIPLAWLAGITAREALAALRHSPLKRRGVRGRAVLACILLALLAAQSAARLTQEAGQIRSSPVIALDPMLTHIATYRDKTRWIYAQPVIYSFHARLSVPPELAVVALKRYWSGQMTWRKLLETVQRYHPEQLLLFKAPMGPEWTQFIKSDYVLDFEDGDKVLYVAKSLKAPPQ